MALSYAHGASAAPLLGDTIGDNLRRTAERHGDREALVSVQQGTRRTWAQFFADTGRCGRGLMARGVGKGDRVGIWSPNRHEWVTLQYDGAHRRDPGQHQPLVPRRGAGVRARAVGGGRAPARPQLQGRGLRGDGRRGAAALPGAALDHRPRRRLGGAARRRRPRARGRARGARVTPEELTRFCEGQIARYKIPRLWKFAESWPMTISGKVQKFKMREMAVAELGLEKAAATRTA